MTMLAQVAVEYGGISARELVLNARQQLGGMGSTTLLIAAVVILGLWWLLKRT